jgi:hypothetical protein
MIHFELLHPRVTEWHIGYLSTMLGADDPRPARQQLDEHYQHGGGWRPMAGFQLTRSNGLKYSGEPILRPIAQAQLRDEHILLYPHDWVAIVQPDRRFEVCRMD